VDPGSDSASLPVFRSIPGGAVDQQRTKGETSLGDITFTRQLDKSSPKLMEACALGKFNKEGGGRVHHDDGWQDRDLPEVGSSRT
jgi:hypothetical protein